jgi:hypothetical protein
MGLGYLLQLVYSINVNRNFALCKVIQQEPSKVFEFFVRLNVIEQGRTHHRYAIGGQVKQVKITDDSRRIAESDVNATLS